MITFAITLSRRGRRYFNEFLSVLFIDVHPVYATRQSIKLFTICMYALAT